MASKANTPSIERVSVDKLIPYARNARTHSDAQVAQIAASMREFGFTNPVLIDADDGIIAGHGRVMAARKLKMADVPCIRLGHLNEAQRRLYVITDNKLALNAGWDLPMLSAEFLDLQGLDADLSLTGFSSEEIGALLAKAGTQGLTDPDDVPEAPETPIACVGDVWMLGGHRLVCGDCTDPLVVDKALAGVKPHLMVTDPPYGVEYDPDWRNRAIRSDGGRPNGRAIGTVLNDNRSDWTEAWALFPGDVAYCWHADRHASNTQTAFEACGFQMRSQIIWAKQQFAIGRGHYHVQHEPCFYMVRKGATGHWIADRKQTTLWQIDKPRKSETGHSTQKPVECMKRPIENNSSPGQAVYEPFSGSGTTIIAAEMTGRTCHAIELNPAYIDVAVKRWEDFTGQKATREELKVAA